MRFKELSRVSGSFSFNRAVVTLLAVSVFSTGCSVATDSETSRVQKRSNGVEIEVITAREQLEQEINETPTAFTVSNKEDDDVWNRAQIFFGTFLGQKLPEDSAFKNHLAGELRAASSGTATAHPYRYQVSKHRVGAGLEYKVSCTPTSTTSEDNSTRNAKNLSRFLKTGVLETSMMKG